MHSLDGIAYQDNKKDQPERTPILLLHGAGSSHLGWPAVFRHISNRRVIAVDLPGHGRSNTRQLLTIEEHAEHVLAFLNNIDVDQVDVIGFSMGAAIVLEMLLTHPERFSKAVFLSYLLHPNFDNLLREYSPGITESSRFVEQFSKILFGSGISQKERDQLSAPLNNADQLYHDLCLTQCYQPDFPKTTMILPTLWMFGEKDAFLDSSQLQNIRGVFYKPTIKEISGAGHMPLWECPDSVLHAICDFLGEYRHQR